MQSINFEFLRTQNEPLASLGGFAEQYVWSDPGSAVVKLRTFGERVVDSLSASYGLVDAEFHKRTLFEKLADPRFQSFIPTSVEEKLQALRKHGNSGAHGRTVQAVTANWLLKETHSVARWYHLQQCGGSPDDLTNFQPILEPSETPEPTAQQLTRLRTTQDHQNQELETSFTRHEQSATTNDQVAGTPEQEQTRTQQIADALGFSEDTTRTEMIDLDLAQAGWDVGAGGASTGQVGKEVEVEHQPTDSGFGYADYVLWDDHGLPIAVIEAKKTARDADVGREQAKRYADGLEQMHGHRPVIFCTNGHEIQMWNDAVGEPPRELHGFPSKDSLDYMVAQRALRKPPSEVRPNPEIAGRMYQLEAVTRLIERFSQNHRSGLIVQATGTGKTRVAVSLTDAMIQAGWARRVLFLCDRRELRKQAKNVFQEFTNEPLVYVTRKTHLEREHRIYLATYPAMTKVFESFDVGFFDLIIADESHRSIFNRYRQLFEYFDAYKVGLTATPVAFISRNTYSFFGCSDQDPTAHFSYEDAVNHVPPYLVPYQAEEVSYGFIERGIKYSEMTAEQRAQLEEQEDEPEVVEYEQKQVDKSIFNKDTNRKIIQNLMENGLRIKDGTELGKSIIFARNHKHAVLLQNIFDELYPQYGGRMCRVIDNYDPRAEELIDEFKDPENPLTVAVSVDMLDTGIDVPEVVNLVFAKPVFSKVKFWQMIGRGTRLCPDLHGPGLDKTRFLIFDHWKNFTWFEQRPTEIDTPPSKSVLEKLFEARLDLAEHAIDKPDLDSFALAIDLLHADLRDLPDKTIPVKKEWRNVQLMRRRDALEQFAPNTRALLRGTMAPLMRWRTLETHRAAYAFDLLIARLQDDLMTGGGRLDDHKDECLDRINRLQMTLAQVRAKADMIERIKSIAFWSELTVASLEEARLELRGIMRYCLANTPPAIDPKVIDVAEDDAFTQRTEVRPLLDGVQQAAYRQRVDEALQAIMDQSPALQKVRQGERITAEELESITALVVAQDPDLDLSDLLEYYPHAEGLGGVLRSIVGLDPAAVEARFQSFAAAHPLRATQLKFLDLLQNHIARYGSIKVGQLYDAPFTTLDTAGIDGVFEDEDQIDELLEIMSSFGPDPDSTTDDDQNPDQNQTQDKDPNHS